MHHIAAFRLAGLWPAGEAPVSSAERPSNENSLHVLCNAWKQAKLPDSAGRDQALAIADRLEQLRDSGAALTLGIPGSDRNTVADWIGDRLAFWPDGIPQQRRVGMLSSHLGHELEKRTAWFTALRATCSKVNAADDLLATTPTVTADRFVRRCHELFGIRLLDIRLPANGSSTLREWGESILQFESGTTTPGVTRLLLSPEVAAVKTPEHPDTDDPLADRTVLALSQRLYILNLKSRGRLLPLIQRRLAQKQWPVASVTLALGSGLVEKKIAEPLLDQGAVGWVLLDTLPSRRSKAEDSVESQRPPDSPGDQETQSSKTAPIIPVPSADRWSFLTHCTRRIDGPWPGQREEEYFDDLILDRESSDHSALSVLKRIIDQGRITASSAAIRGASRVVSFTAVPLAEIPKMRVFRAHRGRWDFEPYGICIARDWLQEQGAKPVIYGDEQTWQSLSENDRPFFQVAATRSENDTVRIDWTQEREWRHMSDIDLSSVPTDAALVFVPTEREAATLAEESPWPIVVLSAR